METSIRIETLAQALEAVPAIIDLPTVVSVADIVYLTAHVDALGGQPDPQGVGVFIERLRTALGSGHFNGKLAPPVVIPLHSGQYLLVAYLRCPLMDRVELNRTFRGEWFVEEGGLGDKLPAASNSTIRKGSTPVRVEGRSTLHIAVALASGTIDEAKALARKQCISTMVADFDSVEALAAHIADHMEWDIDTDLTPIDLAGGSCHVDKGSTRRLSESNLGEV